MTRHSYKGEAALLTDDKIASKSAKLPTPPPVRPKNDLVRAREYLLPLEVEWMIKAAAAAGRYGLRDRCLILVMYRYALRAKEASDLLWSQVELKAGIIHIKRCKGGMDGTRSIDGAELTALRKLRREYPDSRFVFVSERDTRLSERSIHHIVARAGRLAGLDFTAHPHMLRHGCGYRLANKGFDTRLIQEYLGHRHIESVVTYTQLAPGRFDGLWN